ncbi:MAG: ATP-binding cassette domain-containing protein [Gemmatimonadota bacterium]
MTTPALALGGITKRFAEVVALDSATLSVAPGSVHALLGENGAGKTTLMRIAFGAIAPDAGVVQIDGRTVHFHSSTDAVRLGIRMVHQHFALVPQMSALENFALGGHGRFHALQERERLAWCSAELGIALDPTLRVDAMSAAEQQHLEIAKALRGDCRILILDEPTALLAPAQARALLQWTRRFAASGRSVVLITHKLQDALGVADEVTVLRQGRTALSGTVENLTETELVTAMLGSAPPGEPERSLAVRVTSQRPIASLHSVSAHDDVHRERILDVSVALHHGEIVGIAGLERSGHRLLLRVLAGRQTPTVGSISAPDDVAFIPEDVRVEAIAGAMQLWENVAIRGAVRRRGWINRTLWTNTTRRLLSEFDVRAAHERIRADTLSGGNQQRLVLARELAGEPSLIVAENPTRGLDVRAAAFVRGRLRAARDRGAAVVFYSSDLDELIATCDRVLVMYAGRLTAVDRSLGAVGRALLGTP